MIQATSRFNAPMRVSNISKNRTQNKQQNRVQNVNFSGGGIGEKTKIGLIVAVWASVGLFVGKSIVVENKNNNLKEELGLSMPAPKMSVINHNADLVAKNSKVLPYEKSNEYLQDVLDSVNGKKVEPSKKFNIGKLLSDEEAKRKADSAIWTLKKEIKKLK